MYIKAIILACTFSVQYFKISTIVALCGFKDAYMNFIPNYMQDFQELCLHSVRLSYLQCSIIRYAST